MPNISIQLNTPCELIDVTPLNPLISKCQIKVCYVGDEPNRNRSIITKEVAREMANSLPGSPIVGYYDEEKGDFDSHTRSLEIKDGQLYFKDITRPYGFVDLGAKVWFQKFEDNGIVHEYLMTEGYIWTGQYPEAKRIIDKGNNQSMELDESPQYLDAFWTNDDNGKPQFFIINEAIFSKLCVLGEDVEPCFEGSTITKVQFSLEDNFKETFFSLVEKIKTNLNEGGKPMFTRYSVEIGDSLWNSLYTNYAAQYDIVGVYEEEEQKFAVLQEKEDEKYFKVNFSFVEEAFVAEETMEDITDTFVPSETPQFSLEDVAEYAKKKKEEEEEDKDPEEDKDNDPENDDPEDETEDEEKKKKKVNHEQECPDCGKPMSECECEKNKDKKDKYNLDEIQEYIELQNSYSELQTQYDALKAENEILTQFKAEVEKDKKKDMIDSFYMLSDEDKKEVSDNIDTYSLEDIEAKLSILCVRNKVSFDLNKEDSTNPGTTYNLNNEDLEEDVVPAWVKAVKKVAKEQEQ